MKAATAKQPPEKKTASGRGSRPGPSIGGGSVDARRFAVMILDVLAGIRTPTEAAQGLGCSLPRYYVVEKRALEGFVGACESRTGKGEANPERQIECLQEQVKRLERDLSRQQALARLAQRAVGVQSPEPHRQEKGKRKRRPTVRALRMAKALGSGAPTPGEPEPPRSPDPVGTQEGGHDGAQADGA